MEVILNRGLKGQKGIKVDIGHKGHKVFNDPKYLKGHKGHKVIKVKYKKVDLNTVRR